MTEAQESALSQIERISREHFSAALFIAEGDAVGIENPDSKSDIVSTYHGGYATSLGLCRIAELRVYRMELDKSGPNL